MSTGASAAGDRARGSGTGPDRPQAGQRPRAGANPAPDGLRTGADGEADTSRQGVVEREKASFGGVKIGSAFFGWLTAIGTTVLLSALATAFGAVLVANNNDAASADSTTVSVAGTITLLVILFIAYYCGGYVAGRMARFNGIKQGIAVWVWAVVIAIVAAIIAAIAGNEFNILVQLNGFPQIPEIGGNATASVIIAAIIAAAVALLGAILGGLGGMRFHRRVDKAGLGD
ncbi:MULTISPECIES: hypothetical protein [unclassified Arthrobacter]|uniref:hypothetical protein n=1 Tax=unclassified Arthrobacter TaxID=235627 RepID=UPI001D157CE6|nr:MULTISPECIES: hypothetical protein [unclassified Arthrobacter]MCC3276429.1 hypothetical protein [Arthrobacter sp. zg-Y20]MCC3280320.1 hypothetical protein [Arthrobacter sp. zg-Y40]MCC9178589.1 hypothetical protein [Arthrobacter sp. zg-Y750]MDK1316588.1 hypothetical protein [Arthrobacter sp. zg.Y20]MDK1328738.1 hypothetical protein [Arthrobacter sp. zg-Y1143]